MPETSQHAQNPREGMMATLSKEQIGRVLAKQGILIAFAIFLVAFTIANPKFLSVDNVFSVVRSSAILGVMALGVTFVVISGNLDLSVGSMMSFSTIVVLDLHDTLGPLLAIPAMFAMTMALGALIGFLVGYLRLNSLIVTLGMLSVARSLAMVLSNNKMIYQFGPDHDLLLWLGGGSTFGLPHPLIILLILAAITAFAFRWLRWGQHLFAIGGNEQAAVLTGIPVNRLKVSVYMFSALMAGITGILEVGWLGGVTTNLGQAMELTVIAAAVIGGANLAGGTGTAFGAVIGALLIEVIRNSLILLGISTFWQGTFVGSFIVIAVAFDRIRQARSSE